jgi:uncharacterized Zn finger protein
VKVAKVPRKRWERLRADCAGSVASLVELLQGRLSAGVMERICRQREGLFPSPKEISLSCSCPDWADMCKHVAAALYGVGARLDDRPELLFRLRQVDETDLLAQAAAADIALGDDAPAAGRVLEDDDLSALFGVDVAPGTGAAAATPGGTARKAGVARAKPKPKAKSKAQPKAKSKAKPKAQPKVASRARPKPGAKAPAPAVLAKGTAVRMRAGVYEGWSGRISWVRERGSRVTYAFSLVGPDGRKATTQAASSSFGTKWEASLSPPPAE